MPLQINHMRANLHCVFSINNCILFLQICIDAVCRVFIALFILLDCHHFSPFSIAVRHPCFFFRILLSFSPLSFALSFLASSLFPFFVLHLLHLFNVVFYPFWSFFCFISNSFLPSLDLQFTRVSCGPKCLQLFRFLDIIQLSCMPSSSVLLTFHDHHGVMHDKVAGTRARCWPLLWLLCCKGLPTWNTLAYCLVLCQGWVRGPCNMALNLILWQKEITFICFVPKILLSSSY